MADVMASFTTTTVDWIPLPVDDPDGADQVAREVAERGGEHDKDFARALLPELKSLQAIAQERGASPMSVQIPLEQPSAPPFVTATAFMVCQQPPDAGRSLDAIAAVIREPRDWRVREPDIRRIELPLGPACRVRELATEAEMEDGRRLLLEYVTYYVLTDAYPEGVIEFTVTWTTIGVAEIMSPLADEIAATLTVEPAEPAPSGYAGTAWPG
ncbi:hypothetical protein [Streptomyces sp. 6N223]|uniref:hypothetical protein n=1 Tax=Streptomyces sp. 6N223 TaxID=3457412 RepID=UPI003FD48D52